MVLRQCGKYAAQCMQAPHTTPTITTRTHPTCACPDVLPPWFNLQELMVSPRSPSTMTDEEAALKDGQFGVVRSLLRVLDHGQASKAIVDAVIDSCRCGVGGGGGCAWMGVHCMVVCTW